MDLRPLTDSPVSPHTSPLPVPASHPRRWRPDARAFCALVLLLVCATLAPEASAQKARKARARFHSAAIRVQPLDPVDGEREAPWLLHGMTAARPIASISKLMATMVVLDRGLDMDGTTVIIDTDHRFTRTGSRSRLRIGVAYRNRDLLTAALMSSDNRAVLALGRAVGLDRSALAAAMNRKAKELGLKRSRFEEPVGLSYDNVSSAEGVLLTLRAALEYEPIRVATSEPTAQITPAGRRTPLERYVNTNRLIRWGVRGILGGKTGFNREAGHCLTFAMEVGGKRIGVAVLGAPTRERLFQDAKVLADWVREESRRRK